MRLDLFLKWSRVIPRRTLARATCDAGRVRVNGEIARAARSVKLEDQVHVLLPNREIRFRVCGLPNVPPSKADAGAMIEVLESRRREEAV